MPPDFSSSAISSSLNASQPDPAVDSCSSILIIAVDSPSDSRWGFLTVDCFRRDPVEIFLIDSEASFSFACERDIRFYRQI